MLGWLNAYAGRAVVKLCRLLPTSAAATDTPTDTDPMAMLSLIDERTLENLPLMALLPPSWVCRWCARRIDAHTTTDMYACVREAMLNVYT